jgi:predicted acetyltransferase
MKVAETRSRSLRFRRAREEDLERLVEIHLAAYPDPRNVEARQRNFTHNPFGGLEHLVVVEDGRSIVGHAFLFPFQSWFGGSSVKVGGIASVGVAPEARGRGVATALLDHLHVMSDRRGDAITMLYAFRQGYYARLGYATTSSRKRLAIDPRAVPESWRALARERVRGVRPGDAGVIRRLHARAAERGSGWIARPGRYWEMLLARERRMTLVCEGPRARPKEKPAATGYVAFTLGQSESHAETYVEVEEVVAEDAETRRALFGALGATRDQVAEILVEVPETDPLERALLDADGRRPGTEAVEHGLGEIVGGPMVRVEDVPRALGARGYTGSGVFDVIVRSPEGDEADGIAVGVRVRDGRAEVGPARGSLRSGALLTTRAGLAAIFFGGLSASDAVALGLAEADARVAARIDAIARIPPLAPVDAF